MATPMSTFVFLLALSITVVHCQLIVNTNGESGERCGQYHRCLSNSTCLRTPGEYVCVCPDTMRGNAKLGCVPKDSATVFIQSDPHLKNLYNQFLSVSTPCRYRVMEFYSDNLYVVRVFVENDLYKGGELYVNRIEVMVGVSSERFISEPDEEKLTWITVYITGDAVSAGVYEFKERRDVGLSSVAQSEQTRFMAEGPGIFTDYDEIDNLAVIKIARVGLSIWFRPVDKFALQEKTPHMAQVPGVVISVDSDFLDKTQFSAVDLSSTPSGPDLKAAAKSLQMDLDVYAVWLTIRNTQMGSSYRCESTRRQFKKCCTTDENEIKAMKVCGQLYTYRPLLWCMRDEEFMAHLMSDCVTAICKNDTRWCGVLKSHIHEYHCPLPPALARFDCGSLNQVPHTPSDSSDTELEDAGHSVHGHAPNETLETEDAIHIEYGHGVY